MGRNYFSLGKFFGIELRVDYSWFIIFALIAWTVVTVYIPAEAKGLSEIELVGYGLAVTLLVFLTLIAHEYAHSLVANHYGLKIRHITLFLFGGASELEHDPDKPKIEFLMTAAGPATSLLAAGLFGLFWLAGRHFQLDALAIISAPVSLINLVLAIFNLLPAFPLDGGRILRSIIWAARHDFLSATKTATTTGVLLSYMLITLGVAEIFLGDLAGGLWVIFIGWFLSQSARFSYAQVQAQHLLKSVKVREIMATDAVTVPLGCSIDEFLNEYVLRYRQYNFLVTDARGHAYGMIGMSKVLRLGKARQADLIDDYVEPLSPEMALQPADPAYKALDLMRSYNLDILPVMAKKTLLGVVTKQSLNDYITVHELQSGA